ncbi:universal stress protein [Aerococcaceae bacterium DSM 111021]|nr:universal stress protein [Aerococcaceae bacterium DSM 111021]
MTKIYKNILLPVDGSQQSIDAFKRGVLLAKQWDSNVYLVRVVKDDDNQEITPEQRESLLNSLEEYARNERVSLNKELIYGDPRTQIAEVLVNRWSIDLIILGATGKGRVAKMLIGSITDYVVRNAQCDVLISR